jgi:polyvinyl alcohol dehydrogenase (cytochrome)
VPGQSQNDRSGGAGKPVIALAISIAVNMGFAAARAADWPMAGHDPSGNHSQPEETTISAANVGRLAPRWSLTVAGNVNATPAVVDGAVYFPDSGGKFWKVDGSSGALEWCSSPITLARI